jgi:hypothetical protein
MGMISPERGNWNAASIPKMFWSGSRGPTRTTKTTAARALVSRAGADSTRNAALFPVRQTTIPEQQKSCLHHMPAKVRAADAPQTKQTPPAVAPEHLSRQELQRSGSLGRLRPRPAQETQAAVEGESATRQLGGAYSPLRASRLGHLQMARGPGAFKIGGTRVPHREE